VTDVVDVVVDVDVDVDGGDRRTGAGVAARAGGAGVAGTTSRAGPGPFVAPAYADDDANVTSAATVAVRREELIG
jgi:hypothetical protein